MKALYRKYRPKSLSEVVGQEKVTDILKSAIDSGKFSHAYLFTGPRGTGKTSVARIFAHEINNFPYEIEDSYVDIIEIDAASNTGVDNIRELREKAAIAPSKGKYKVYIIDEVHMLSKSAFNALLKTLEEPPAHVIFLLATTDLEKVPVTITSRVQIYTFALASPEVMLAHLKTICEKESIDIEEDALKIIVRKGGGSFRDSLSLLDQISALNIEGKKLTASLIEKSFGLPKDELVRNLLSAYESGNFDEIVKILKEILSSGTKPELLAEELLRRILESPSPSLLPLLDSLTSVYGKFPEAKLLLALSPKVPQNTSNSPIFPQNPAFSPTSVATSVIGARSKSPKSFASSPDFPAENPKISTPNPPISPETTSPDNVPESAPASVGFNWTSYSASVQKSSFGAAMWLKKSTYSFDGATLHLYPNSAAAKGILESPNNRDVLQRNLGSFSLKIHDFGEKLENSEKPANSANFSAISDIMGELKEVKIDGGDLPF